MSAKTTKYIPKCCQRSVTMTSNLSFVTLIKKLSFDQRFFICCVWNQPLSNFFGDNFLFPAPEYVLIRSATLSCKTLNISTFSILAYYNTNILLFFWEVSYLCSSLYSLSSLIKVLSVLSITSLFWNFILSCFSLVLY